MIWDCDARCYADDADADNGDGDDGCAPTVTMEENMEMSETLAMSATSAMETTGKRTSVTT